MTYQETIWKDKRVMVVSVLSKSGKVHKFVKKYVLSTGKVVREAKNNMLVIQFKNTFGQSHYRAIPAGCLMAVQ